MGQNSHTDSPTQVFFDRFAAIRIAHARLTLQSRSENPFGEHFVRMSSYYPNLGIDFILGNLV